MPPQAAARARPHRRPGAGTRRAPARPPLEIEIKLPAGDLTALKRRLAQLGFRPAAARQLERNWVFDDAAGGWRRTGRLLRLRQHGREWRLTAKGPARAGRHKRRPEIELPLAEGESFRRLARLLGLGEHWYYEKYRTRWRQPQGGEAALDETPTGNFLELEGRAGWIDRTAKALGYSRADYILASYAELYRRQHPGGGPMRFGRAAARRR